MARVAHREGYPEIGLYWEKAAYEEAEHAAKFAELLGEVVTDSTKKNLEMRVEAENGATAGKFDLAKSCRQLPLPCLLSLLLSYRFPPQTQAPGAPIHIAASKAAVILKSFRIFFSKSVVHILYYSSRKVTVNFFNFPPPQFFRLSLRSQRCMEN